MIPLDRTFPLDKRKRFRLHTQERSTLAGPGKNTRLDRSRRLQLHKRELSKLAPPGKRLRIHIGWE
jgi:hypothetical protein